MPVQITKEQCNALIKLNPVNNKSELDGLYKKLIKECNQLYANKESIQKAVMESVKLTLGKADTIASRIHNLKVMRKYLSMISPCIVSSELTPAVLALVKKEKGVFTDKIYFTRQIGTESVYGVAYLNTGVDEGSRLVFSAKITTDKHKNEMELLKKMSYAVQNNLTPNFPVIYKILHCKNVKEKRHQGYIDITSIDDIIKHNKYYVILNELASGDLSNFLEKQKHSSIEYESIIFQAFISMRAFHIHTNHIHDDSHFGNFLYHKIEKGGHWHYRYNKTDIYVPNTGYLLIVWDPGLAQKIKPNTEYMPHSDYLHIYSNFRRVIEEQNIDLSQEFFYEIQFLVKYIIDNINDTDAIMKYLEKKPKFKNILFAPPLNSHIINDNPYYL
jgi:hypothetical protein